jgi:hypothetical protein
MSLRDRPEIRCATDTESGKNRSQIRTFLGGNCRENEFLYPLPDGSYWEASFI